MRSKEEREWRSVGQARLGVARSDDGEGNGLEYMLGYVLWGGGRGSNLLRREWYVRGLKRAF